MCRLASASVPPGPQQTGEIDAPLESHRDSMGRGASRAPLGGRVLYSRTVQLYSVPSRSTRTRKSGQFKQRRVSRPNRHTNARARTVAHPEQRRSDDLLFFFLSCPFHVYTMYCVLYMLLYVHTSSECLYLFGDERERESETRK